MVDSRDLRRWLKRESDIVGVTVGWDGVGDLKYRTVGRQRRMLLADG